MSTSQAVFFGAFLFALGGFVFHQTSMAQSYNSGPYQIMHHSNPTANAGVFRLDTSSGEVSYCYVSQGGTLACSQSVR